MKKSIFLGFACLSLVIALIACAPATTPIPTKTPTSIPLTSTPTPTPTPTPKPATHTPPPATATPTPQPIAVVTADALNLRAGPGTVYDKKGLLHKGEKLNITARTATGDWIRVLTDGTEGWISATYVELLIPLDSIPVAVEIPPTPTALVLEPTSTPTSLPATPKTTPTTGAPNVQIECIFYDGLVYRVESDEYVQITNFGNAPQNLAGWKLVDISEGYPSFTFPSYILEPGASVRVYTNEYHPEWGGFSFGFGKAVWNNKHPDVAALYNAQGQEVSRKSYPPGCR